MQNAAELEAGLAAFEFGYEAAPDPRQIGERLLVQAQRLSRMADGDTEIGDAGDWRCGPVRAQLRPGLARAAGLARWRTIAGAAARIGNV
ncbi:MAG: hypothetical protein WDN44_13610 [Sphingomonas sp.]